METFYLVPVLALIFFLIIGQVFKLYFSYDLKNNLGLVVIKLWGIKLQNFSFQIKPKAIIVRTTRSRQDMEYKFSDPKFKFYENFSLQVKEKTKLKYVDFYSKIGSVDASVCAVGSALVIIFCKVVGSFIKNTKPTCTINVNNYTDFKNDVCSFSCFSKLSLSVFDFLYCLIFAWFETKNNT